MLIYNSYKDIKQELLANIDLNYKKFNSKIIPGAENILGIRMPILKNIAQKISKQDEEFVKKYFIEAKADSFEEIVLQGLVIGYLNKDFETIKNYIFVFIPKINNWGICDSFCSNLKITKKYKSEVWEFLDSQNYINSEKEFIVRFWLVMILNYYVEEKYIDSIFKNLDKMKHTGYYVQMAKAWTISKCFLKLPDKTLDYLKNSNLDKFTYNKSLQKITESLLVDEKTKRFIKSIKIK